MSTSPGGFQLELMRGGTVLAHPLVSEQVLEIELREEERTDRMPILKLNCSEVAALHAGLGEILAFLQKTVKP